MSPAPFSFASDALSGFAMLLTASYISLGWLQSFLRLVMADSTPAVPFLPSSSLRVALDWMKCSYSTWVGETYAGSQYAGLTCPMHQLCIYPTIYPPTHLLKDREAAADHLDDLNLGADEEK